MSSVSAATLSCPDWKKTLTIKIHIRAREEESGPLMLQKHGSHESVYYTLFHFVFTISISHPFWLLNAQTKEQTNKSSCRSSQWLNAACRAVPLNAGATAHQRRANQGTRWRVATHTHTHTNKQTNRYRRQTGRWQSRTRRSGAFRDAAAAGWSCAAFKAPRTRTSRTVWGPTAGRKLSLRSTGLTEFTNCVGKGFCDLYDITKGWIVKVLQEDELNYFKLLSEITESTVILLYCQPIHRRN